MTEERKTELKEYHRKRAAENPEREKQRRHETYLKSKAKRRLAVFTKLGLQCVCCGEDDIRFLTVEHKLANGNEDRKTRTHEKLYRDILKMDETEMRRQFETLCMQCNFAKGKYKICPHQLVN